jgi:hypothetical protein
MTMVRKQVFITPEQNRLLKQRAKATRRPEAELIRAAIDRELGIEGDKDDWKAGIMATFGALADEEGLEERIAELRRDTSARLDQYSKKLRDLK